MPLYPLKFAPKYLPKIWGGRKLHDLLGRQLPPGNIGESWEIYDFPAGVVEDSGSPVSATVANGPLAGHTLAEILRTRRAELYGHNDPGGSQFPLLIKYLDAREDLSVQVHPDAAYCTRHPGSNLKNEAWYIAQAEPGSRIYKGVVKGVDRAGFAAAIAAGDVEKLLRAVAVKTGDCHYLPSGTVHAVGVGILAAEVQTPSDSTFRVYDFNRPDPGTGRPRMLHIEQALECIDFATPAAPPPRRHTASLFATVSRLMQCPQFTLEKVRMSQGVSRSLPYEHLVIWMVQEGCGTIELKDQSVEFVAGETLLLPAEMDNPILHTQSDCVWLEATLPPL